MEDKKIVDALEINLNELIKGKKDVIKLIITSILSRGHILLEDIPGVGKTTLAKGIAKSIDGKFSRIQFTPDLLPSDILGSPIYNPKEGTFEFKAGPVFCNILLADEINRASPRTQAGLLESMSETQVTMEGKSYKLAEPFLVIATQNPVDFHGTYPLPEAQMDRFAIQISMGYPSPKDELNILYSQEKTNPLETIKTVMAGDKLIEIQKKVSQIQVEKSIAQYLIEIITQTRKNPFIKLGVSPRGTLMLFSMIKASAFLDNRDYCIPDDVKNLASAVLSHRIILETKAKYAGTKKQDLISDIVSKVVVPR